MQTTHTSTKHKRMSDDKECICVQMRTRSRMPSRIRVNTIKNKTNLPFKKTHKRIYMQPLFTKDLLIKENRHTHTQTR